VIVKCRWIRVAQWIKDIEEVQNVTLQYPIIADENKEVANLYDMIHPNANETLTVRSVLSLGQIKDKIKSYLSCFYRKEF
jgi:alkyl hydroperoxide reductase subunit AhpC